MRIALVLVVLGAALAHADATSDALVRQVMDLSMEYGLGVPPKNANPPRLVLNDAIHVSPSYEDAMGGWGQFGTNQRNQSVGISGDGKAAWVSLDLDFGIVCGMEQCMHDPPAAIAHATALFEPGGKVPWQPVAWDLGRIPTAKELAKAKGKPLAAMPNQIDAGAEDVAKQFSAALADPVALGKAISDRKDALLYGSELAERYVGGATVRATLAKWKLAFKIHDGIQAGLTAGKGAAFIAANVDAGKPGDKATAPYRAFAIFEKLGAEWKIVVLAFSAGVPKA